MFTVAASLGQAAFAQQTEMPMHQGKKPQMEGMMKSNSQTGMMGQGKMMGQGGMMGRGGMMGKMHKNMMRGMHKNMMGQMFAVKKSDYSNNDIKRIVDGRLAQQGFSRLKAGDVKDGSTEKEKTAFVDVVSAKGEFLFQVEVNRKTGMAIIVK